MNVSDAKKMRALEDGNAKLKRTPTDAVLDNAALPDRGSLFACRIGPINGVSWVLRPTPLKMASGFACCAWRMIVDERI